MAPPLATHEIVSEWGSSDDGDRGATVAAMADSGLGRLWSDCIERVTDPCYPSDISYI